MRRKRRSREEAASRKQGHGLMLLIGMQEWRQQHPRATLREIEEAVDQRLAQMRAGLLDLHFVQRNDTMLLSS